MLLSAASPKRLGISCALLGSVGRAVRSLFERRLASAPCASNISSSAARPFSVAARSAVCVGVSIGAPRSTSNRAFKGECLFCFPFLRTSPAVPKKTSPPLASCAGWLRKWGHSPSPPEVKSKTRCAGAMGSLPATMALMSAVNPCSSLAPASAPVSRQSRTRASSSAWIAANSWEFIFPCVWPCILGNSSLISFEVHPPYVNQNTHPSFSRWMSRMVQLGSLSEPALSLNINFSFWRSFGLPPLEAFGSLWIGHWAIVMGKCSRWWGPSLAVSCVCATLGACAWVIVARVNLGRDQKASLDARSGVPAHI